MGELPRVVWIEGPRWDKSAHISSALAYVASRLHSLIQRTKDKLPLRDAYMRDAESLMIDDPVLVEKNVEVNVPRALVYDLLPTHGVLDILQPI